MEDFLYFLLKSACILFLFYGCYWLFLRKETFFSSNRLFFILGLLLSIALPWVSFTETILLASVPQNTMVATEAVALTTEESAVLPWTMLLLGLYGLGVFFFGSRLLLQFLTLYRLKKISHISVEAPFHYVQTPKPIAPFSFFNAIFYHPNGFTTKELDTIIRHEKVHAVQKHSLDILLAELLFILQWFNPIAWLYKVHLKQNLEFLADEASQSTDRKFYQMLLLKEAVGNTTIPLATSFYTSIIKKRIVMLNQKRSKNISLAKSFIVLPALALFLMAFHTKTVYQVTETQSNGMEVIIRKNTTNQELESIKKNFAEKEMDFSYTAVRNRDFEIIDLALDMRDVSGQKNPSTNGYFKTDSDVPIAPILIQFDEETNRVSIRYLNSNKSTTDAVTASNSLAELSLNFDKDTKESSYPENIKFLAEKGIKIDFKGVKRNRENEITDIKVFYDNGAGQKGSYVSKSNNPIDPFTITIQLNGAEPAAISIMKIGKQSANIKLTPNTTGNVIQISQKKDTNSTALISQNDTTKKILIRLPSNSTAKSIKIKSTDDSKTILLNDKEITIEELEAEGDAERLLANTVKIGDTNGLGTPNTRIEEVTIRDTNGNEELIKRIENNVENESEFIIIRRKGQLGQTDGAEQNNSIGVVTLTETRSEPNDGEKPLIFIDGKKVPYKEMTDIEPENIFSVNVFKGASAVKEYGEEGKNGVILITTKKE